MNRIAATMKQLVAEVTGDGEMFDKATQEQAMAHSGRKGREGVEQRCFAKSAPNEGL